MRSTSFSSVRQDAQASRSVAVNTTLTRAAHSGQVQLVTANAVITLPAVAVGQYWIVECDKDGILIDVNPDAADLVIGPGITGTDNFGLRLAAAVSQKGDRVRVNYMGATGFYVAEMIGSWTTVDNS